MTTLSIPPNKMFLLAALGIGAYWFTTKRGMAAPSGTTRRPGLTTVRPGNGPSTRIPAPATTYRQNDNTLWAAIGGILNAGQNINDRPSSQPGQAYPGGSGSYNEATGRYDNGATGDAQVMPGYGSSTVDGMAANPVFDAPYDYNELAYER